MAGQTLNFEMMKLRLIAELKADKKKAVILSVLFLVATIIGLKTLLQYKGPQAAEASIVNISPEKISAQAHQVEKARDTSAQDKLSEYLKKHNSDLKRDIFGVNITYFTPIKTVELPKALPTSAPTPAEDIKERQRKMVQAQAADLVLESTMLGQTSVAVINGKILRSGDYFSGFQIVEIAAKRCKLTKDEITVTLEIKK